MRAFRALAEGHAETDRLREARFVGAVRVAVNGSADQVAQFLDTDRPADGGDFASPAQAAAGFGMGEDAG